MDLFLKNNNKNKEKNKKFLFGLLFSFLLFYSLVPLFFASAQMPANNCDDYCSSYDSATHSYRLEEPAGTTCLCSPTPSISELIARIVRYAFYVAILITPLMIIVGAYYIMTSGGDPERVKLGKGIIVWTLVGFAIIISSRVIIAIVKDFLGQ